MPTTTVALSEIISSISCLIIGSVPLPFSLIVTLSLHIHSLTFVFFFCYFYSIHFLFSSFPSTLILLYCFVLVIGANNTLQVPFSSFLCICLVNIEDKV